MRRLRRQRARGGLGAGGLTRLPRRRLVRLPPGAPLPPAHGLARRRQPQPPRAARERAAGSGACPRGPCDSGLGARAAAHDRGGSVGWPLGSRTRSIGRSARSSRAGTRLRPKRAGRLADQPGRDRSNLLMLGLQLYLVSRWVEAVARTRSAGVAAGREVAAAAPLQGWARLGRLRSTGRLACAGRRGGGGA